LLLSLPARPRASAFQLSVFSFSLQLFSSLPLACGAAGRRRPTSLRAFSEPRPRASAFQRFSFSAFLFCLSLFSVSAFQHFSFFSSAFPFSAFQRFSFSAFSQKTPTP
jgi:hypothetical protein